jgi:hypothetical protein
VMLVSCHGSVNIDGVVNAGGGGGVGGMFVVFLNTPGYGGGAGGVISIEGANISVTGSLFANGGAGGGGSVSTTFADGEDGSQSDSIPAHGGNISTAGAGGDGGFIGHASGIGRVATNTNGSAGGGGGSVGFLQTFVPAGVAATITPAHASPALPPTATALVR